MRRFVIGEYEVIEDFKNGTFKALRHGEEWKDLIGDNLTLALIDKIEELEQEIFNRDEQAEADRFFRE
jgi:hypothetical protein